jgi:type III restriction enzyme
MLAGDRYKPLLFVVAICIKDAEQARDMMERDFKLKTLLVTEKSDDREREDARRLGKPGSPYDAVVSVLMLREGWDVPAVSVILLLRKFSSRVYGQQVVGRGLRLNMRGEDAQEICAIVDHAKLKHQWLWEMVGAKVRTDVDQLRMFGDEDLPPKRKQQFLANPELLIKIPDAIGPEVSSFDTGLDEISVIIEDIPDWPALLDIFTYDEDVEITDVEIKEVTGKKLERGSFREIYEPPTMQPTTLEVNEITDRATLVELLRRSVRDIAEYLLAEEGIGSHELGYFYDVLMNHVRDKMLQGKSAGVAEIRDLQLALKHRTQIYRHFRNHPGLVTSIVTYRQEDSYAWQ